jgi:hypothetical protein
MLGCRIANVAWFWTDLALTSDATLELRLHFLAGALFKRISATDAETCESQQEQNRQGPHLLIL